MMNLFHEVSKECSRATTQRRSRLAELEPHMLADIGLTHDQALREAVRPVWDAPAGWLNRK